MDTKTGQEVLETVRREYQIAVETCRHLETQRAQHLGFFFTVALGVLTFGLPMIFGRNSEQVARLTSAQQRLALFGVALAMLLLTVFVHASVHRFGSLLMLFEEKSKGYKGRINELTGSDLEIEPASAYRTSYLQVRSLVELILIASLVLIWVGCLALMYLGRRDGQVFICIVWAAMFIAVSVSMLFSVTAWRHTIARLAGNPPATWLTRRRERAAQKAAQKSGSVGQ